MIIISQNLHFPSDESPFMSSRPPSWTPPPDKPPHPRGQKDQPAGYLYAAIAVIIMATVALAIILIYFCRNRRDRTHSLEQIITRVELSNIIQQARQNQTQCENTSVVVMEQKLKENPSVQRY